MSQADMFLPLDSENPQRWLLTIQVHGLPQPQGSKEAFVVKPKVGKPKAVIVEDSKRVGPWRQQVIGVAAGFMVQNGVRRRAFWMPVNVRLWFSFPRPMGHFGAHGNLLPSAPKHMGVIPDVDKLARAILDSLAIAGVLENDSRVGGLAAEKDYVDLPGFGPMPGVRIEVSER